MIRKYILPVLAIIGVGVAVYMVMQGNRTPPVAQPVVQSARAPFASYIFGPGIVEARTENIAIGTPVSGIVTAVYVKWGDRVSTGDPLFKMDSSDLQAQVQPALAKVKEAQVEQIKTEIERRTVRARLPGRILQMKTRLGEYAQTGPLSMPLMLLGNDDRLHVRVDVDENDAWRFHPCASAIASVRGNPELKTPVKFEHTDPDVVPRVSLTGDSTQRVDSRVLQVIYSFDRGSIPIYVGQQMDVFIEVSPDSGKKPDTQSPSGTCGDDDTGNRRPTKPGRRKS